MPNPPLPPASIKTAARHYFAHDYPAAARECDAILAREPLHYDALHLRGVLSLEHERQPAEALELLCCAMQQRDDDPQLHFHVGNVLLAVQRHEEAAAAFRRSLALRPGHAGALNNLGNALIGSGHRVEAVEVLEQALALQPGSPQALYNLGRALMASQRITAAVERFRAALDAAGPDVPRDRLVDIHVNLGEALVRLCRYQDALAVFRSAPRWIADAPALVWNAALTSLVLGDFETGWRGYESRFHVADHDPPRDGTCVLDLAAVAGRRVLLFPEQGRGDMLQFARYLPLLAEHGAEVLVQTYADLKPLFATIDGVTAAVTEDEPAPPHDLLTPLMSLPLAFGTALETVPANVPYLHVPPDYAARWAQRLGDAARPRVGIVWRGSTRSAPRSAMTLADYAPILAVPGVEFHCLQKEISEDEKAVLAARGAVRCHEDALGDFADSAALIARMDLVISIDTAVAHLAGALGQPVWIMLPFSPDWRWLQARSDSPWYPTARLFRQAQPGSWDGVVTQVVSALKEAPLGGVGN